MNQEVKEQVKEALDKLEVEGKKPVTVKVWVLVAVAVVSFVVGAILL